MQKIITKYDHQVPRYTSYPPATQFRAPDAGYTYASWLRDMRGDVSLYVHIPFCARLCYYCGCNMRVVNDYAPVADYLSVLKREMVMVSAHAGGPSRITHIHFGGGSPTMIAAADFGGLMQSIRDCFDVANDAEISIEADPRNMSEARIAAYAKAGVTRISLGVQDFNDDVLESINRPQPYHATHEAVTVCRAYGLNHINFDLMYGLPGQTPEKIRRNMELAVLLNPDRIAYFGYAHVPWMKRHMNLLPQDRLPNLMQRYELQSLGADILQNAGYEAIGIDHYVRPLDSMALAHAGHRLRRNFQGYTTDLAPTLIGLGASSIGECDHGHHQNAPDVKAYMAQVSAGQLPTAKILTFRPEDRPVKALIESLMCYLQVDLPEICGRYSLPENYFDEDLARLVPLQEDGIVRITGRTVIVDPRYRVLTRVVCEAFDRYAHEEQAFRRHAQAV